MANQQQDQGKQAQGKQTQGTQQSQSQYWRQQFQSEPYYQQGRQFEDYEPAYRAGELGRTQLGGSGQSFEQSEQQLRSEYENSIKGQQNALKWNEGANLAARAAWERAGQSSDRDIQSQSQQSIRGEGESPKSRS